MGGSLHDNKRYNAQGYFRTGKFGDIIGGNYINIDKDGVMSFNGTAHINDSSEQPEFFDNLVLTGRMATGSLAGSTVNIDATIDQYGEGFELRYNISDWVDTYTLTAGKGMYLRMETNEANASGSIYGMELYGVTNNVNLGYLWGALCYAYVKGTSAKTLTGVYAFQPEISFDAGSATNTITDAAIVRAKLTGGVMSNYTVLDGYRLTLGDMDGQSRTYGNGILLEDDASTAGTNSLTTGININIACAKGIDFKGVSGGAASASGIFMGAGTSVSPATTSTADAKFIEFRCQTTATSGDNRLAYLRYDQNGAGGGGECIRAFTKATAALGTARGAHISFDIDAAGSVTGLGIGVDAQLLVNDVLPAGGTYFALQAEAYMVASSSIAAVTSHAILSIAANGDATAVATVKHAIAFKGAEGTGNMIYNNNSTGATESNGSIAILVDEGSGYVTRYLRYWDAENS